jgi:TolB-like protein
MRGVVGHAHAFAAAGPSPPVADCREQLNRILSCAKFDATERERRFLTYVVEEELSGRGDRIKAYSIAIEVFGRDSSFDPQADPIVRVEAGHVRRVLERYYFTAGLTDPVVITIPKGGYVPSFLLRPPSENVPVQEPQHRVTQTLLDRIRPFSLPAVLLILLALTTVLISVVMPGEVDTSEPEIPKLFVSPIEDLTDSVASAAIATGLTQEIVGQLSKFKDIVVVESIEGSASPPRFELAGSVSLSKDSFRLRMKLKNHINKSILWANNYDGGLEVVGLMSAQTDIARNVATTLAQTYGVIYQTDLTIQMDNAPDDWAAYSCTLSYYAYRANLDPEAQPAVRTCLERAVERFPAYATAWALLSQAYIDEVRFIYPHDPLTSAASFDRALAAARRAVELDPLNIRALQAKMFALYFSKEIEASLAVGKQALETNPNDTELMGEYGYRLALSGNWGEGCPLIAEARERNPGPFAYYEAGLALCSYFKGNYADAAMWIRKTAAPTNINYHMIAAAIFAEGRLNSEAEREVAWLNANAPALVRNVRQEVAVRISRSQDVEFFLTSLRKAGLKFED